MKKEKRKKKINIEEINKEEKGNKYMAITIKQKRKI